MSMRKLIELSDKELKELYNKNSFLREEADNYAADSAYIQVDEFLRPFDKMIGVDYSIGDCGDYFNFNMSRGNLADFLSAAEECGRDYCFLTDELNSKITRAKSRADFYIDARNGYENISDSKFEKLEEWIEGIVADVCRAICDEASDFYTSEPELLANDLGWFIEANYADYTTDGALIYEPQIRAYA